MPKIVFGGDLNHNIKSVLHESIEFKLYKKTLIHFVQVLNCIWKPIILFAVQIK